MPHKILHIAAHLGGGVGKALSGIAAYEYSHPTGCSHEIILLEEPEKTNFIDICQANGVKVDVASKGVDIAATINKADIVQLEWWHHPAMAGFLATFPRAPVRLVIWSHVSGSYYPYIVPDFLRLPRKFVFTSPCSFDNPYWDEQNHAWAAENCAAINSSGGFSGIVPQREPHTGFTVGYIGTQSYSKLHPRFMEFCHAAKDIPHLNFRMVGDKTNERKLSAMAAEYGLADKFTFIGYVTAVGQELANIDVFGYILNPKHFGTTENVLLEAMAAEVPVVCLNQGTEKYIVRHEETGLLVNSVEEYGNALRFLYEHPEERKRLGENARKYVLEHFSVRRTVEAWHTIYDEVLRTDKSSYDFEPIFGATPHDWFLACLPPDLRRDFTVSNDWPDILKEPNKSSLPHFSRIYPHDEKLRAWNDELASLEKG